MARLTALFLLSIALLRPAAADTPDVTVFAAASMTSVLTEIAEAYSQADARPVKLVFGSSATLARQIEHGAPATLYLSANSDWIDYLTDRDFVVEGSRRALVGNRLVVAVPGDSAASIDTLNQVVVLASQTPLALADPDSVPAGRYAKEALINAGHWQSLSGRTVYAPDVRATLTWIARGEVSGGIVYATDAAIEPKVQVAYTFLAELHAAILYEAVLIRGAGNKSAARPFLDFLTGPEARTLFHRHGFLVPPEEGD
jgi:molybdate transport system substrate-binding protein